MKRTKIFILFFSILAFGASIGAITGAGHQIYVAIFCTVAAITLKIDLENIIK
jgi:hypothetical protein